MATLAITPESKGIDALSLLTVTNVVNYRRKQVIYNEARPPRGLHLVISGKVKISRHALDGRSVLVDILGPGDPFGEAALRDPGQCLEEAIALEDTGVMQLTRGELLDMVAGRPQLSIALLGTMSLRMTHFGQRIESLNRERTERRLLRALAGLSKRLGTAKDGSWTHLIPLTHQLLSEYVGTSREVVTHHMNRFRRMGYLQYSRAGILLRRDVFEQWQ